MPRSRVASLALALALGAAACQRPPADLREWRASDHSRENGEQDNAAGSTPPDTDPMVAALALYRATCAGCHGPSGRGDGPSAGPMMHPADYTTEQFQRSHTDEQLREVILRGRGMMPGFSQSLRPEAVDLLVQQIRRFGAASGR